MPDFSLVPIDYQPEFESYSLVPVDYDPFGVDGVTQQAQAQPQPPATGVGHPNVGAPANSTQQSEVGESWNPDAESNVISGPNPSTASASPQNKPAYDWLRFNQPFGELKPATFTPTQQIGYRAADALTAIGMQPYTANDLTKRIGNVLGWTPFGVLGSALDLIDAVIFPAPSRPHQELFRVRRASRAMWPKMQAQGFRPYITTPMRQV